MPVRRWQTKEEWEQWTLENCVITDNGLELAPNATYGSATIAFDAGESWKAWSVLTITGSRPEGSNVIIKYRTADTFEGLNQKNFVVLTDGSLGDGSDSLNLGGDMLKNNITPGRWIQLRIELYSS